MNTESTSNHTHSKSQKIEDDNDINNEKLPEVSKIDDYLKNNHFNGNITIYKNNKPIMSNAYGYKDFELGIKNDRHSMYLIGSANKFITGLILRQLEDEGKLNINDNVNKYIPHFQNVYPITLKDLMLHQSGLHKFHANPLEVGLNSAIESIKSKGVNPNKYHQYEYNDVNYITLAKVIENVTHKSFAKNLKERIIDKVNLKYTSRFNSTDHQKYLVKGYKYVNGQNIYAQPRNLDKYDGAGNIYISTDDMAKIISKFKSGQLLSHSSTQNLLTVTDKNIYPSSYRYGFYKYKDFQRFRGIFYSNDIVTFANDEYIVSIASNQLEQPYDGNTEKTLKHIFSNILNQNIQK
nr:serine hydrolase domain-containing protein [Mammaliicoccus sp. Marseille-Q6498]